MARVVKQLDVGFIKEPGIIGTAYRLDVVSVERVVLSAQGLGTDRTEGLAFAYTLTEDRQAKSLPSLAVATHREAFSGLGWLALAWQPTTSPTDLGFHLLTCSVPRSIGWPARDSIHCLTVSVSHRDGVSENRFGSSPRSIAPSAIFLLSVRTEHPSSSASSFLVSNNLFLVLTLINPFTNVPC